MSQTEFKSAQDLSKDSKVSDLENHLEIIEKIKTGILEVSEKGYTALVIHLEGAPSQHQGGVFHQTIQKFTVRRNEEGSREFTPYSPQTLRVLLAFELARHGYSMTHYYHSYYEQYWENILINWSPQTIRQIKKKIDELKQQ